MVTYNANPFHWDQVAVWARHLWRFQKFLIVTAVLIIVVLMYLEKWLRWEVNGGDSGTAETGSAPAEKRATSEGSFLSFPDSLYLVTAFLSFLLVGKEGAAANYLLEFHVALALLVGIHAGRVERLNRRGIRHHALGILNVLVFLGISFHSAHLLISRSVPPLKGGSNKKGVPSPLEGEGKGEGRFDDSFSG